MIANAITCCRILISMLMFLFSAFSPGFYVCYLIAGISDMIDGTIARKLGTSSKFGEKLDTVADFAFAVAALFKLLPVMKISMTIWIWTGLIAVIKLINIISGFVVQKRFVTVHSVANKITGALLFVLPLTLSLIDVSYSAIFVCLAATFAAIQEGHIIRSQ
ncbi:MAG: CDP-alcohol phosphatidyltransferase family protein [Candidatus Fimousia sp.]